MDFYIGQICTFGFNFAPVGWALCNGASLSPSQNAALFSLLSTYYGGNGTTTFNLPDLQGRFPMGMGTGAGLSPRTIATKSGSENATVSINNLPAHTHSVNLTLGATTTVKAATEGANTSTPANNVYLAAGRSGLTPTNNYFSGTPGSPVALNGVTTTVSTSGASTGATGNGQPMSLMNPFLVLNFCIAVAGVYPSRP